MTFVDGRAFKRPIVIFQQHNASGLFPSELSNHNILIAVTIEVSRARVGGSAEAVLKSGHVKHRTFGPDAGLLQPLNLAHQFVSDARSSQVRQQVLDFAIRIQIDRSQAARVRPLVEPVVGRKIAGNRIHASGNHVGCVDLFACCCINHQHIGNPCSSLQHRPGHRLREDRFLICFQRCGGHGLWFGILHVPGQDGR